MTVFDPRGRENKRSDRRLLPLCALGFVDCRLVHRYDRYAGNVSAEKGSMVQKLGNVFGEKGSMVQKLENVSSGKGSMVQKLCAIKMC